MRFSILLIAGYLLAVLLLLSAAAIAQPTSPISPAPPVRRWHLSANLWHPATSQFPGIVYNLRAEHRIGARTSLLMEGAFRQRRAYEAQQYDSYFAMSLGAGVRYYFGQRSPKGLYGEALLDGTRTQRPWRFFGAEGRWREAFARAELAAGYQFIIVRRIGLDVGLRAWLDYRTYSEQKLPSYISPREWWVAPTLRLGVFF